jgi:Transmembrane secretion effector
MLRINDLKILRPLQIRDFALLWTGMTVSLLGDGIYLVALAWQTYALSDTPTALSLVGVAWTAPMVVFLLVGGVASDRIDRRKILMLSDAIRGVAVVAIGVLSVAGELELWHMFVLVAVYGIGDAFFGPAFGAIVPDIVPSHLLLEANSLGQFVRPFAMRLAGPAVGGLLIATVGGGRAGPAFLVNGASFAVSALCLWFMVARPLERATQSRRSVLGEVAEGLAFVRSQTWLWATLLSALISLLFWVGPFEVLIPFVVKNHIGGGADDIGLVFAAGGVGAVLAALIMAQVGLPRRHMLVMFWSFGIAIGSVSGFGFVTATWQAMGVSFVEGVTSTVGMIIWGTLMHRLVPTALLGRVESLDWLTSISLVPVSFAITGPIAEAIGVDATLIWSGVLGGAGFVAFMLIPGVFDTERDGRLGPPSPAPGAPPAPGESEPVRAGS